MYEMRERFVEVNGLLLNVCEWGLEDGIPIVCLHGFLHQGAVWHDVAEILAPSGARVIAPDARGHGHSGHVGPGGSYHFADYLRDLDGLLRDLGGKPVTLVGHSMGGTAASMYAGLRPDAIRALVIIEGLGPPPVHDEWAVDQLVRHLDELAEPPEHAPMTDLADAVARMRRPLPELSEVAAYRLAERVVEPHPEGGLRWRWDALHRTRSAYAFDRDRYLIMLGRIRAPTTLVCGQRGAYDFPDLAAREAAIRSARRVLLPSGHNPHMECPGELAEVLWKAATGGEDWA
jgi:pimeloyl-ACP methyl ester carboxylesterase